MSYEDFPQAMELLRQLNDKCRTGGVIIPLLKQEPKLLRDPGCGNASYYDDTTRLLSFDEREKLRESVQRATEASCADIGIRQGYTVPWKSQRAAAIAASITMASENMATRPMPVFPETADTTWEAW